MDFIGRILVYLLVQGFVERKIVRDIFFWSIRGREKQAIPLIFKESRKKMKNFRRLQWSVLTL